MLTRAEALACIPVKSRQIKEQRLESGEVRILYPRTAPPWMLRWTRWLGYGNPPTRTAKLELDRLGSSVWDMLDGRSSIRTIAASLAAAQRLEPREAEVAVAQFIRELGRRGLIGLR